MSEDEDESTRITRKHDAVITWHDIKRVETAVFNLRKDLDKAFENLFIKIEELNKRSNVNDVWRATIDMRLAQGVEKMNAMQKEIDDRVEKKIVIAYLAGAACGGAGLTALIMKALGA